jgi:hypothetical protein
MKTVEFTIKSISPMLMHSDRTANPLNEYTKKLKALTGKRKKTDDDHAAIAKLEFIASCYYNKNGWYIPAANFEAMLLASAKHFKLGTTVKQALLVPDDAIFDFNDRKLSPEDIFSIDDYVDTRTVKVGTSKTMRTRPIFHEYEVTFACWLDTDKMNVEQLKQIVENAGRYVGLGDYRPRYGRFEVIKTEVSNG